MIAHMIWCYRCDCSWLAPRGELWDLLSRCPCCGGITDGVMVSVTERRRR